MSGRRKQIFEKCEKDLRKETRRESDTEQNQVRGA